MGEKFRLSDLVITFKTCGCPSPDVVNGSPLIDEEFEFGGIPVRVCSCECSPPGTVYMVPPIPMRDDEDLLEAFIKYVETYPKRFGKIERRPR